MKTLVKISWRNIWRNRTRSIVIITALVLGLMGGIFSAAIRLAAEEQQFEETIENQISHIQIHHPEFIANPEAYYRIPDGEMVNASFRVEGLYSVTSRSFEERTIFADASEINKLIGDPGAVTEIAILLYDSGEYRRVSEELRETWTDLEIRHWAEIDPTRYYVLEVLDQTLIWLVGIIILGVSFGLLNTILMSILERVREIGVLMSIGMKRARVFSMIVVETIMISLIGGFIGLTMSWGLIRILNVHGVRIPGAEGLGEFGYAEVLYPDIETAFYFQTGGVVIMFAILASIYPAWKAINLQPAKAVKQE